MSSEITLHNVNSSQVSAGTVSGEITYSGTVEASGSYEFTSHSGDVRVDIPANSGANLQLQTYSGSIRSQFRMTMEPGSTSRRGKKYEFTVGAGGARISVETFSGDITIGRNGRSGREE